MALTIKQNFIVEELVDENGNHLGELKFNPGDNRIMSKLQSIINESTEALDKLKKMGDIPKIDNNKLETIEDFENNRDNINKLTNIIGIETDVINNIFNDLYDVFGKETVDIFTGGTQDISLIEPLIEFVMPYVTESRKGKVNQYMVNKTKEKDVL